MNDTPNEQQLTDALRGIAAAGGPPDEAAGWAQVQRGIAADRTGRNRRILLGGAGLAVAGAAAALVLVLGTGDDQEAVETGPAAESTTTTPAVVVEPEATTTTVTVADEADGAPVGLPEHPVVVVTVDEGGTSHLHLHDADTGAPVVRDLADTIFGFSDLSIEGGTIYFTEEGGDSEQVLAMPWDGSAEPTQPFGLPTFDEESTRAGTLSPDGSTFAYVEQGVVRTQGRIALVDTSTLERRYLEWADGEEDLFLTQGRIDDLAWSPGGDRLAFVSSYEGAEVRVVDVDAASLSASEVVAAGTNPAWFDERSVLFVHDCCFPDFDEPREVQLIGVGVGVDIGGASYSAGAADVVSEPGWFAIAELAGGITVVRNDGDIRQDDVRHLDVDGGSVVALGL